MNTAKIYDIKGKEQSKKTLRSDIFDVKPSEVLLKQAVVRYLAGLREPIAKTKTRAERRGGGRKPWRQKGTGRARVGSRRTPIWRKGGVVFGPTGTENFTKKMNKKSIRKAIQMALSVRASEDRILILDNIQLNKPQTKEAKAIFDKLPIKGRILFISEKNPILLKSVENIPFVMPTLYNQLNSYDILVSDYVVILKDALDKLVSFYGNTTNKDNESVDLVDLKEADYDKKQAETEKKVKK
ncbi:50S ribosomal protein L4 [bacterium CG_4_10_14_0_2_um_filter_33_32]|nr:MAG: 50S ribosomal protein L4 [bacterium CG2_30_33_46]PIR67359.1 MAG: 50S ribosomal protein L4 [bacterium CG10_big_fil_rev_8_21_14_0_10_33_18]PIU76746.1 MAG: 50S ribosomal protein L4 [bacterium CG06_land_8_20_14_3_00_33_50]PIW81308.1 MAG: 50S ribosomal protein L4 [bacterium CG_4_8_14_3_um_filter_33_28]PIY85703.1 MAG: 50S ribosomal protein L4 [bacterium CG_4_10_14_0_8_um_filter_33_57]PIZ86594.1 MAG: 50S ribosomal protein L4 [bacterium CG_4_10_14_0_2_um_filter_33_32]PJA72123.1 MAG: 50S ribos